VVDGTGRTRRGVVTRRCVGRLRRAREAHGVVPWVEGCRPISDPATALRSGSRAPRHH
jgi:hypothetical protein